MSAQRPPAGGLLAVAAGVVAAGVGALAEGPLWSVDARLAAANALVAFAAVTGAALLATEPGQRGAALGVAAGGLLWCVAAADSWHSGPWPLAAAWVGALPELLVLGALLRYPRPPRSRWWAVVVGSAVVVLQGLAVATTLTAVPPRLNPWTGAVWFTPWLDPPLSARLWHAFAVGSTVVSAALAAAFVVRTARFVGRDRVLAVPIAVAICAAAAGSIVSGLALALDAPRAVLRTAQSVEDVLLLAVPGAFVGSIVLRRSSAGVVGGLVPRLRADATVAQVRDALRLRLADPLLDVHWGPLPPAGSAGRVVRPVAGPDGRVLASLSMRPVAAMHDDLVEASVGALRLFALNHRLQVALSAEIAATEASERRLARLAISEREHLRRLAQGGPLRLIGAAEDAGERGLAEAGDEAPIVLRALDRIRRAELSVDELSGGRHPAELERDGLAAALAADFGDRPQVVLEIAAHRLPPDLERAVYYALAEAVTNAVKHAAASRIAVHLAVGDQVLVAEVVDDGRGGAVARPGVPGRFAAVPGATSEVESPAGGGTTVRLRVDLGAERRR